MSCKNLVWFLGIQDFRKEIIGQSTIALWDSILMIFILMVNIQFSVNLLH